MLKIIVFNLLAAPDPFRVADSVLRGGSHLPVRRHLLRDLRLRCATALGHEARRQGTAGGTGGWPANPTRIER